MTLRNPKCVIRLFNIVFLPTNRGFLCKLFCAALLHCKLKYGPIVWALLLTFRQKIYKIFFPCDFIPIQQKMSYSVFVLIVSAVCDCLL